MILRYSKQQRLTLMTDPRSLLSMLNVFVYEIIVIVQLDRPLNFILNCERELPRVRNTFFVISCSTHWSPSIVDLPKHSIISSVGIMQNQDKNLTNSFIDKLNYNDFGSVINVHFELRKIIFKVEFLLQKVEFLLKSRIHRYAKDTLPIFFYQKLIFDLPEDPAFSTGVQTHFQMQISMYWINLKQKPKQIQNLQPVLY